MSDAVDVLLVGLGAIGTVYSYILERSGKVRVTAVARSNYGLYTSTGVKLETDRFGTIDGYKPHRVFRSVAEALADGTEYAVCLVCTKCLPDVLPTTALLADALKTDQIGTYVLIQNGLDVENDLAKATKVPILSCVAYCSIMANATGNEVRWRNVENLAVGVFRLDGGKPDAKEQAALDLWINLLTAGEGRTMITDDIRGTRFAKNVWTCTQAGIQSLVRTYQTCFRDLPEEHHAQIKKFYREVLNVGFQTGLMFEGMELLPTRTKCTGIDQAIEMDFDKFIVNGSPHKWSMLLDVENGRPFEVEVVVGSVVRLARERNIPTPLLDFVYTLLKGLQQSIIEARNNTAPTA